MDDKRKKAVAIVLLLAFGLILVGIRPQLGGTKLGSIAGSFEGPHFDVFGFQPVGQNLVYTANNDAQNFYWVQSIGSSGPIGSSTNPSYSWQFTSQQTAITKCQTAQGFFSGGGICDTVQVTSNNPYTGGSQSGIQVYSCSTDINAPDGCVRIISYWTRNPYDSTQWFRVYGYIVLYSYQATIAVQSGSNPNMQFKGDTVWLRTYSPTWNNYGFDPGASNNVQNGTLTGAWSAPLVLVLQNGQDAFCTPNGSSNGIPCTNDSTIPDYHNNNAPQGMYTTPLATSALGFSLQGANSTLANGGNAYAPDTQLSQFEYFPIVLSNVGAFGYNCILGQCNTGYPSINLNFQIYYIQLGRYLFTNPVHHPLVTNPSAGTPGSLSGVQGLLAGFGAFLQNPFAQLGISLFVLAAIAIIVFVFAIVLLRRVPVF